MSSITNQSLPNLSVEGSAAGRSAISKVKGVISSALALLGLIVTVTGIGLFVAPHGPVAAKGWTFLGMNVPVLKDLHIWLGFGMAAFVLGHFALNLKTLIAELKQLFR
ncbi:DUF4405 domain-containing protein [Heliobacterium undosum]|uniref:DUF4405 domain-containing protein n=1 Tax=Heliomicrobium undosum TaxID=121734 RepID=A0A845L9S5_9FIRM|nr:DUF4405 domain-containing protein [Heliomicrobium undosum]MZP30458.1 DUF4405 domain-containing protein [Heliomicrobium undosum]